MAVINRICCYCQPVRESTRGFSLEHPPLLRYQFVLSCSVNAEVLPGAALRRRFRGEESGHAPWLALLPHAFSTPFFCAADVLDELRGTTLFYYM